MIECYGITKEQLREIIWKGEFSFDWSSRHNPKQKHLFDLYIVLYGNHLYRIATYSNKTKQMTLTCPQWFCPDIELLKQFWEICDKKGDK